MASRKDDEAMVKLKRESDLVTDKVDIASDDSFPSSDPPAFTPVTGIISSEEDKADFPEFHGHRSDDLYKISKKVWAIPEGYLPARSHGPKPEMKGHETVCILNIGSEDAHVSITAFYADRDPGGPYQITVPARRAHHVRFNQLDDPEPIAQDKNFASVIESDCLIVVQYS